MKLICIGDSLTFGYGVRPSQRWTRLCAQETGWEIVNEGISGDTTGGMLVRLRALLAERDICVQRPLVLLMGGANDIFFSGTDTGARANMGAMLNTVATYLHSSRAGRIMQMVCPAWFFERRIFMPRKNEMGRAANGTGSIRKIERIVNGKKYTNYQGRYTTGYDPGTGKQVQGCVSGKTKKEVAQKLTQITADIDNGTFIPRTKTTLGDWLDTWYRQFLINVKPRTLEIYEVVIRKHIKPYLGATALNDLTYFSVQNFYNDSYRIRGLSAKSMRNVNCVLHSALQKAVEAGLIRSNPANNCVLPKIAPRDIHPFDEQEITAFLKEIKGDELEDLLIFTLFTGLREGEVMGLQWKNVDFQRGTILINRQWQRVRVNGVGSYQLVSPKNNKSRILEPASFVMELLRRHKTEQERQAKQVGASWENSGFVFTDATGHPHSEHIVYRHFKRAAVAIGRPDARFHDLRHSYAVASLRAGDDIKTLQSNLGHATAAFTLDVYGHVTDEMRHQSSSRMGRYIQDVLRVDSTFETA